jgi:tetratricopeptide (TPR) repeat protein
MIDAFGSEHVVAQPAATAAFANAVHALASHRPHACAHLEDALQVAPTLTAAHALSGMAGVLLAGRASLDEAATRLQRARLSIDRNDGATAFERALVNALDNAVAGRLRAAADVLDDFLYREPNAFLAAKLSHALRFMTGDVDGMVSLTARLSSECERSNAGYGYLLGCHAFGLEEIGRLNEAERVGRAALEIAPDDAWGLHAVAHVFETRNQVAEGSGWLEAHRGVWTRCNNLSRHFSWHLALFALGRGDHESVLDIYDREVAGDLDGDFRDFANAASMLWRLRQAGIDPGETRWAALSEVAERHARNTTLVFGQLHFLLALIGAGRLDEAADLADFIHESGRSTTDQANVSRNVGAELASALVQAERGAGLQAPVGFLARRLHRLGGSHAQRDVFLQALARMAQEAGDAVGLRQVLAVRRRHKADDRPVTEWLARSN